MKIAFVITMYDEHELVRTSILNILKQYSDATIHVVHSYDGKDFSIADLTVSRYHKLENLYGKISNARLPSHAVCRNFSRGFSCLYADNTVYDVIVAMTGDTLIGDPESFERRRRDMASANCVAAVSQAVGQRFHASTDDPDAGVVCGRLQTDKTTDFACCLFIVDGKFASKTNAFANICITNDFTSEQCLGDEMLRALGTTEPEVFHKNVMRLNKNSPHIAYSYGDGITYHARTNGRPGR